MIPADWNFPQTQAGPLSEYEQLDVESESDETGGCQNRTANIQPERLEPALGVPKWQPGRESYQEIENSPPLFAQPGLMAPDQAAIKGARAKGKIDFSIGDRCNNFRYFVERCGKIGIEKQPDSSLRCQ